MNAEPARATPENTHNLTYKERPMTQIDLTNNACLTEVDHLA